MHSTLLFYNQRCFTIKTNTSDGCFRKTFTYNGKRYSVRVKTARDLWHKVVEKSSGYLFTQPTTGRPHTETSMKQMWRSFKQALDLDMGTQMASGAIDPETSVGADDLTPYCLWHTYATDLQSAGVPLNVAKDLLGHQSIAMTSHIYTHLSDEAFTNASLKVLSFATESRKKAQKKVVSIR